MENAVKALSMIGSVLLSLLIVGLLVFSYNSMRLNEEGKLRRRQEKEVETINAQFETYLLKKYLIGSEVLSIANLANDYNGAEYLDEGYEPIDLTVILSNKSVELNIKDFVGETRPALFPATKKFLTTLKADGTYSIQLFDAYEKDIKQMNNALNMQYRAGAGKKYKYGGHSFNFWLQWIDPTIQVTDEDDDYQKDGTYENFVIRYYQIVYPNQDISGDYFTNTALKNEDIKDLWMDAVKYLKRKEVLSSFSRLNFEVDMDALEYDATTGRIKKIVIKELGI